MGIAKEVGSFNEHVGCEQQIIGGAARTVDGAIIADPENKRRSGWDSRKFSEAFGDGSLVSHPLLPCPEFSQMAQSGSLEAQPGDPEAA
jgi:hypothetical protein